MKEVDIYTSDTKKLISAYLKEQMKHMLSRLGKLSSPTANQTVDVFALSKGIVNNPFHQTKKGQIVAVMDDFMTNTKNPIVVKYTDQNGVNTVLFEIIFDAIEPLRSDIVCKIHDLCRDTWTDITENDIIANGYCDMTCKTGKNATITDMKNELDIRMKSLHVALPVIRCMDKRIINIERTRYVKNNKSDTLCYDGGLSINYLTPYKSPDCSADEITVHRCNLVTVNFLPEKNGKIETHILDN